MIDNISVIREIKRDAHSAISFIDELLQSDWLTYDEIISKLEKSESIEKTSFTIRTIQNHFKAIKELACSMNNIDDNFSDYYNHDKASYDVIESRKKGRKTEFRYVKDFKLIDIRLGERIRSNLLPFIEYLRQIKGLDDNFDLTLDVLEDIIGSEGLQVVSHKKIMRIDNRTVFTLSGIQSVQENLPTCRRAIAIKSHIKIKYEVFGNKACDLIVSPYMIVEYNNRWTLIGRLNDVKMPESIFHKNDRIKKINNFPFDRIDSVSYEKESSYMSANCNIDRILDSSIGASINWERGLNAIEEVILEFSEQLFPYFITKPLHKHFNIDEERRTISYNLIPNIELENIIMSYGAGIKVLKPESLKTNVIGRVQETLNLYGENNLRN